MNSASVSFVIPHAGRTEMLVETIDSILAQDCDDIPFEIIVVTQNQDLEAQVPKLLELKNLKIIHSSEIDTISRSRNIGAYSSTGEFLAFLDADICLATNWLGQVLSLLENSDYILVSAIQVNSFGAPPLERIRTALANSGKDSEVKFLHGSNLFLRRRDFDRVGGFPEHLVTCEDYYFTNKVSRLGKLFYTSRSHYVHLGEDKHYGEMFRKEIWRGQSNLHSIRGRELSLGEIPSFVTPPLFTLMLLLTLLFVLTANPVAACYTLLLPGLLLSLYVFRLQRLIGADVSLLNKLKFYCYYFPARTIGTFVGLIKVLKSRR
jgi:glycosyltransferase involved in cell wall biosynthesis